MLKPAYGNEGRRGMIFGKLASIAFAGLMSFALMAHPLSAATIVPVPDSDLCKLSLSGPIEQGDYDRFMAAAQTSFIPREEVGESTSANTICLDSPGGSLLEGMLLARHFYEEGVGTVVRSGDLCASACALMFMMGRAVGSEVSFINRKMGINAKLGFHRPSLRLQAEGAFGSRDIEDSYDMAVTAVVDYIVLANKTAPWSSQPMVHSDLVERIFATPGDDIFFIDTVEKAARWDIELLGMTIPTTIDEERAYYACENALQWKVALHEAPLDFVGLNLSAYSAYSNRELTETGSGSASPAARLATLQPAAWSISPISDSGFAVKTNTPAQHLAPELARLTLLMALNGLARLLFGGRTLS